MNMWDLLVLRLTVLLAVASLRPHANDVCIADLGLVPIELGKWWL
jgi:hypothetical protein